MSDPTASSADRLGVTLLFSAVAHAVLALGITFEFEKAPPRMPSLDVILVQSANSEKPDKADFIAQASNSADSPRTGAQSLKLVINGGANDFAGAFQDVAVTPGQQLTWSGFHRTSSSPLDVVSEIRIEWKLADGGNNGATPNQLPVAPAQYTQFSMLGTAPANTAFARVVYAIQTFTDGASHTGTVYVDDASLTVVPEPASLSMIGLGALATLRRRRSR